MPWFVVRNSPAESSILGVRSSCFKVSAPRPAPLLGSATGFSDAFDLLFLVFDLFLDWLIPTPFSFWFLCAEKTSDYRADAFLVRAFLTLAASSAFVTSLSSSGGGNTAGIPSASIQSSRVQPWL